MNSKVYSRAFFIFFYVADEFFEKNFWSIIYWFHIIMFLVTHFKNSQTRTRELCSFENSSAEISQRSGGDKISYIGILVTRCVFFM